MPRHQPRLGFQALESRHALAGIVTIVPQVTLSIGGPPPSDPIPVDFIGDGAANGLEIRQLPAGGGFQVTGTSQGGSPTMLQYAGAQATSLVFPGLGPHLGKITIDMKGADDRVAFKGDAIPSDVTIDGGDGNDSIQITATFLGSLGVVGGSGNDQLTMTNSDVRGLGGLGSAVISMGAGADTVTISQSKFAGNLLIFGNEISGSETDASSISLNLLTIGGALLVTTSNGNDTFAFRRSTVTGATTVVTGGGSDGVTLASDTLTGTLSVQTEGGNDTVALNTVSAEGILVDLGDGDDTLTVKAISAAGTIAFNGGPGTDKLRSPAGASYLLSGFP